MLFITDIVDQYYLIVVKDFFSESDATPPHTNLGQKELFLKVALCNAFSEKNALCILSHNHC